MSLLHLHTFVVPARCYCLSLNDKVLPSELREDAVKWCVLVVKQLSLDQELTELALNYVLRYYSSVPQSNRPPDRASCLAITATSFYIAIKVHCKDLISSQAVSVLTGRLVSVSEIEHKEKIILNTLQWRLCPPTIISAVRCFLHVPPISSLPNSVRSATYKTCLGLVSEHLEMMRDPTALAATTAINIISIALAEETKDQLGSHHLCTAALFTACADISNHNATKKKKCYQETYTWIPLLHSSN